MKKITAIFFENDNGSKPVREWLQALSKDETRVIGQDIKTAEYGWPIGMPTCRSLGKKLFEVRSNLPTNKIARVIFTIKDSYMILLHGFIKKTQETPKQDIDLALKRLKELK